MLDLLLKVLNSKPQLIEITYISQLLLHVHNHRNVSFSPNRCVQILSIEKLAKLVDHALIFLQLPIKLIRDGSSYNIFNSEFVFFYLDADFDISILCFIRHFIHFLFHILPIFELDESLV